MLELSILENATAATLCRPRRRLMDPAVAPCLAMAILLKYAVDQTVLMCMAARAQSLLPRGTLSGAILTLFHSDLWLTRSECLEEVAI